MKYVVISIPALFIVLLFSLIKGIDWLATTSFSLMLAAIITAIVLSVEKAIRKIRAKMPQKPKVSKAKAEEAVIEKAITKEEDANEYTEEKVVKVKKAKQKKQKKFGESKIAFAICVLFGLLALPPLAIEFSEYMVRRTESPQVQSYFNPHFYKSENGDLLTEAELIAKEGQPTSSEEWNYNLPDGRVYQMKTLSYTKENGDSREFSHLKFDDGVFRLVKITLMEWIPYGDKDDILKMFNLQKTNQSIIQDLNVSYRAWNVGVEGFWIPTLEPNHFDLVIITYKELL